MDFAPLAGAAAAAIAATWLAGSIFSVAPILVGLASALVAVAAALLLHDEATPLLQALPTGPGLRHARRAFVAGLAGTIVVVAVAGVRHLHDFDAPTIFMPSLALFATANVVYAITLPRSEHAAEIGAASATAWLIAAFVVPRHLPVEHVTAAWRIHPVLTVTAAAAGTFVWYLRRTPTRCRGLALRT